MERKETVCVFVWIESAFWSSVLIPSHLLRTPEKCIPIESKEYKIIRINIQSKIYSSFFQHFFSPHFVITIFLFTSFPFTLNQFHILTKFLMDLKKRFSFWWAWKWFFLMIRESVEWFQQKMLICKESTPSECFIIFSVHIIKWRNICRSPSSFGEIQRTQKVFKWYLVEIHLKEKLNIRKLCRLVIDHSIVIRIFIVKKWLSWFLPKWTLEWSNLCISCLLTMRKMLR